MGKVLQKLGQLTTTISSLKQQACHHSTIVSQWSEVLDNSTDLEEATGHELNTEDEEEREDQEERSRLLRPNSDSANEQVEQCVSARLEDSVSASHEAQTMMSSSLRTGSLLSQGAGTGTGTET